MIPVSKPVAAIIGVGPGNGAAVARAFSRAGYAVALLARRTEFSAALAAELGDAAAISCDVLDPTSVIAAFSTLRQQLGEVDSLIFNAGSGVWGSIEDVSAAQFEASWRVNALGLFVCAQQVIPWMKTKGQGNILIVGATASRRGAAQTAAFAPAKAAQRSLAESMARQLGPAGIHVALTIIDGVVDLPETRKAMPDKPEGFFVKPDAVADNLLWLAKQDRSAWSFEIETRPFGEKW